MSRTPKIKAMFVNTHMACNHVGLLKVLELNKIKLEANEVALFVNRLRTKAKVLDASGDSLGYVRIKRGQIHMTDIQRISKVFGGRGLSNPERCEVPPKEKEE